MQNHWYINDSCSTETFIFKIGLSYETMGTGTDNQNAAEVGTKNNLEYAAPKVKLRLIIHPPSKAIPPFPLHYQKVANSVSFYPFSVSFFSISGKFQRFCP